MDQAERLDIVRRRHEAVGFEDNGLSPARVEETNDIETQQYGLGPDNHERYDNLPEYLECFRHERISFTAIPWDRN